MPAGRAGIVAVPSLVVLPTVYVADTFTRADGSIGTAETGGAWTSAKAYTVYSNASYANASGFAPCWIDTAHSDGTATGTFTSYSAGFIGIVFRYVDDSNYMVVGNSVGNQIAILSCIAGSFSLVGTVSATNVGTGTYTISVTYTGTALGYKINGVAQTGTTSSQFQTATKAGFLIGTNNSESIDGFSVTA
jgi:hypothetical protein